MPHLFIQQQLRALLVFTQ